MKVLILGSKGLLGQALLEDFRARPGWVVHGVERGTGDLSDPAVAPRLLAIDHPDAVVNAAAWSDVDGCERDPAHAEAANATAPGHVARACAAKGVRLVHLSTDFVFDGRARTPYREDDPPAPLSVYGRTKLAGEQAVLASGAAALVVRTAWLYGPARPNFVGTVLALGHRAPAIDIVDDEHGNPTYAPDLARAIGFLLEHFRPGRVHAVNAGVCSRFDWARAVVELLRHPTAVRPWVSRALSRPAPRPAWSAMDTGKLSAWGFEFRPWRDALIEFLTHWDARKTPAVRRPVPELPGAAHAGGAGRGAGPAAPGESH